MTTKEKLEAATVAGTALTVLIGLVAVWWWALLGMDPHVGAAAVVTVSAIGVVSFAIGVVASGLK